MKIGTYRESLAHNSAAKSHVALEFKDARPGGGHGGADECYDAEAVAALLSLSESHCVIGAKLPGGIYQGRRGRYSMETDGLDAEDRRRFWTGSLSERAHQPVLYTTDIPSLLEVLCRWFRDPYVMSTLRGITVPASLRYCRELTESGCQDGLAIIYGGSLGLSELFLTGQPATVRRCALHCLDNCSHSDRFRLYISANAFRVGS